jgi:hypothetical protein
VPTSVAPYDNHSSAFSAGPFVPNLGSFTEAASRKPSVGLLGSDRMDTRRHSLAPSSTGLSQEAGESQLGPASAGYAKERRGSMDF